MAQNVPPPASAAPSVTGVVTAAPTPAAMAGPDRLQLLSPAARARITARTPKFEPVVATTTPAIPPGTDLREIDKPKNTIIRLPNFEVQEDNIPDIKPRDMITPGERLRQAYRKNPGLKFGSLPFLSNDGVALFMRSEDERLERMKEMDDLMSLLPAPQQKQVKPMVDDAFMRKELPR